MSIQEALSGLIKELNLANLTISAVLRLVIVVSVGMLAIRLILKLLDRVLERSPRLGRLHVYLRSGVKMLLTFLVILMGASALGVDVTAVIALFSVAGLAVSLALQNTLANLAGGIMLVASHPFEAGDYIESDGVQGTVSGMDLAYTTITTPDNKEIYIPNSQLSSAKIINYNRLGRRRIDLTYAVSYDAPTGTVKGALEEALAHFPQILKEPAPEIRLSSFGESSVTYLVRFWVGCGDYWNVYYGMQETVRECLRGHGAAMTYNHLNVHLLQQ